MKETQIIDRTEAVTPPQERSAADFGAMKEALAAKLAAAEDNAKRENAAKEADAAKAAEELRKSEIAQREEGIQGALSEREGVVAEGLKVAPVLNAAKDALSFFEQMSAKGVLTDPADVAQMEQLKAEVASLSDQREKGMEKHDELMSREEVYDRVKAQADAENASRDSEAIKKSAEEFIQKRVEEIGSALMRMAESTRVWEQNVLDREFNLANAENDARGRLNKTLQEIPLKVLQDSDAFKNYGNGRPYADYIGGLQRYRESLGILSGKKKDAVDLLLKHSSVLLEADKKAAEVRVAEQTRDRLYSEVAALGVSYENLMRTVWESNNKLEELMLAGSNERPDLHSTAYHKLQRFAEDRQGSSRDIKELRAYESVLRRVFEAAPTKNLHIYDPNKS